jgi:hypothetical protein
VQGVEVGAGEAAAEVAGGRGVGEAAGPEGVEERFVVAAEVDVLQAGALMARGKPTRWTSVWNTPMPPWTMARSRCETP